MSDTTLRAHAEVLRDALEALLLRVDVRGGNPGASEAIRATVRALSTFADLDLDDPGSLASIEDARSGLEMWGEAEGFEKRLLASLDALVSLALPVRGGVARLDLARALFTYATEWWVPDGGRSFAFALALSCLASEAAMRWVVLGAQRAPEAALHAFEAGLALGSSPAVSSAILALAATESPPLVKLALGVARRRRYFHASLLPLVLHPDRSISMAALRMIAFAPRATAVEAASGLLVQDAPGRTAVTAVACEVLAMLGDPRGVALARDLLGRALAEGDAGAIEVALRVVALAGDRRDADLVQRAALAIPGGRVLLAYFGAPEHALVIVEQLRVPERVEEAEHALLRLTGLRFEPPFDVDATKRAATERLREQSGRIRSGAPHTLASVLDELRSPTARQRDRETLRIEASMMAREPIGVDLEGWVARQRADLEALARAIAPRR